MGELDLIREMAAALTGARDVVEAAIDEWGHDGDVKLIARIDAALAKAKAALDAADATNTRRTP